MNTKPASLRRSLTVSLAKAAILLALIVSFGGAYALGGGFDMPERATDAEMMEGREPAAGSPAALVKANQCWTGEAPADMAGKFPGHVVVTPEAQAPRYAGPAMVAKALAQMFDGEDHGLTVHGFCR